MPSNIQYEIPTWNQIYDMLLSQAQKIQAAPYTPDVVAAVARGGLIPARIHLDLLGTGEFAMIQVEFYTGIGQVKAEPTLKQGLTTQIGGKKVLLVDDIADTGRSLRYAAGYLQSQGVAEIKSATLYCKPQSTVKPDFYEKETANWVIFPWDARETLREILQKQQGKRQGNQEIAKLIKSGLPKQLVDKLLNGLQQEP